MAISLSLILVDGCCARGMRSWVHSLRGVTSIQAHGLLAVPRDIANIVASNRSEVKSGLTNTEAAIELLQKLDWKYTFLQGVDGYLTE